jgi:hypothetical protein
MDPGLRGAFEQGGAEFVLELPDRPTEGRLRHVQAARRPADVALLGRHDEIPERA